MSNTDFRVIIAIDFGTTFSGCAYTFVLEEEIYDISYWPNQNNQVYPKIQTMSLYPENGDEMLAWGNAARLEKQKPRSHHLHLLKQFKLYLDEQVAQDMPSLPNDLTIVDVISDYLQAFHQYVLTRLEVFTKIYQPHQFRYCLTVPAMWSNRSKHIMRKAAIQSGMIDKSDPPEKLMLISEPEAAALYCQKKVLPSFNFQHGDRFMMCDAGGGTIDLIVFEIEETMTGNHLKECTQGYGKTCGSLFLDKRMRILLKRKLKEYMSVITPLAFEWMMDVFVDVIKPQFDGKEDHFISIPANRAIGLDTLCITAAELKTQVFEPVVREILGLIETLLSQTDYVDALFLVGGLGSSQYLYKRVHETLHDRIATIAIPPRAEMAVVRGAAYLGRHPQLITKRVPRNWYGIATAATFDPSLDPQELQIRVGNQVLCRNRFHVFAKKGVPLDTEACISQTFFASYPHSTQCDIYAVDTKIAPRYTTHPCVRKIGTLTVPMPSLTNTERGDKVVLQVNMYFGQVELRVEAIIHHVACAFSIDFDL